MFICIEHGCLACHNANGETQRETRLTYLGSLVYLLRCYRIKAKRMEKIKSYNI